MRTIESLIAAAKERELQATVAKLAAAERAVREARAELVAAAPEVLGGLWQEFMPHATLHVTPGGSIPCFYRVEHPLLEMFHLYVPPDRNYRLVAEVPGGGSASVSLNPGAGESPDFGAWLRQRRDAKCRHQAQQRTVRINALEFDLRTPAPDLTEEAAKQAHAELYELVPDHPDADALLTRALHTIRVRDEQARATAAYQAAMTAYLARREEVIAANRERLAELQRELNEPFRTWLLTYAVVVDKDHGGEVETRTCRVLFKHPNNEGEWRVVTPHGATYRERFHDWVSVAGPVAFVPTGARYSGRCFVEEADAHLYYHPAADAACVGDLLAAQQLAPLPTDPAALA